MHRGRTCLWLAGLLILVSLPARFASLNASLWTDEAWVANSLLEPSLHDVFFTKAWTQSSPPLFLLLERWAIAALGSSEAALRLLPLAAALAGLVLATMAWRHWLSPLAALLSLTLLCSNYYVVKYGQQVKQYGADFFVSALLLVLVGRYIESRARGRLVALLAAGAAGMFLSYITVFWLVTLLISAALPRNADASQPPGLSRFQWRRMAGAGCVLGSVLTLVYLVFIRPNRTAALIHDFQSSYLDLHHPLTALQRLISTIGTLLVPLAGPFSAIAGSAAAALAAYAAVRAIAGSRAGEQRCLMVALSGALPLACALGAGALGLYPVLDFPRMLLFALPSTALLLGESADVLLISSIHSRAHQTGLRVTVVGTCVVAVVASQVSFLRYPRPAEENRSAMAFVKSRLDPGDLLFVHGGMYEQFKYYRTALGFHPEHIYIGNKQWPCCATGDREEATSTSVKDFESDLLEAARRAKGHGLWLLFPAGSMGHWSALFREKIQAASMVLLGGGCQRASRRLFGQTLVESYSCR
jgi:hypothetical protein